MTDKQKFITNRVARLSQENARMRVALTEIAFRCERQLKLHDSQDYRMGLYLHGVVTEIRDTAKKALESPNGTLTIKKGSHA